MGIITSRVGYLIGWRSAATCFFRNGKTDASQEKRRQKNATKPNWIRVSVAGFGNALRMAFEDVFVKALETYHTIQRI